MKELSLNILDIAENSVKAKAPLTQIILTETEDVLTIEIIDNGCGMTSDIVKRVIDPFYTTRTTRKVGLGIPFFKMEAEQTGGTFEISSRSVTEYPDDHGTAIKATFHKDHIDFIPLGDVVSTILTLIQGHPDSDFLFRHTTPKGEVSLDTREIREELGGGISLAEYEVIKWIEEYLKEQYQTN
ncbi:sensor histidine kinase [bacterium]|nr:sensor histidine kinase [bacterium]